MKDIIQHIRSRAADHPKRIVLAETSDERALKAASFLAEQQLCEVILTGEEAEILSLAKKYNISLPGNIKTLSLHKHDLKEELIDHFYNRRKHKNISREKAEEVMQNALYFATALVAVGQADGCVAGSVATTGEVIRAAIYNIGLREGNKTVSSIFLMALKEGKTITYADCGVIPYPDEQQLADIALESARTHELLTDEQPVVAMLSFSTKGSARHERTEFVKDALAVAKQKSPALSIDGELQFDAAFVPEIARRKAPDSKVAGRANVFIFPDLNAGNIAYKITERLAGATATGPILQGLAKPVMDLSRGCSWQDIVNASCVAALME